MRPGAGAALWAWGLPGPPGAGPAPALAPQRQPWGDVRLPPDARRRGAAGGLCGRRLGGLRQRAAARAAGGLRQRLAGGDRPERAGPLVRPHRGGARPADHPGRAAAAQAGRVRGARPPGRHGGGAATPGGPLRGGSRPPVLRSRAGWLHEPGPVQHRLPAGSQEHRGHHLPRARGGARGRGLPAPRGAAGRAPERRVACGLSGSPVRGQGQGRGAGARAGGGLSRHHQAAAEEPAPHRGALPRAGQPLLG